MLKGTDAKTSMSINKSASGCFEETFSQRIKKKKLKEEKGDLVASNALRIKLGFK